jgi:tripartite-type tricarboxylate transporter receptor subunit TctC
MKYAFVVLLGVLAAFYGSPEGAAQSPYPNRTVKIVVGFPAGTSADIVARIYAQKLSEKLGQQFIVETRIGASSNVAAEGVARSDPDGYTILLATAANSISASAFKNLKFDLLQDFEPIAAVSDAPNILVVSTVSGISTVEDLIKTAKSKPTEITFGSAGVGTVPHLSGELFNMMTGTRLIHVPYRGNNQGLIDLVSGRITTIFAPAPTVAGFLKDERVKALATTSAKRTSLAPDLPTLAELGLRGFDTSIWYGLLAPKETAAPVLKAISDVVLAANQDGPVQVQLKANGAEPLSINREAFAAFLRADVEKWSRIVKFAGISME